MKSVFTPLEVQRVTGLSYRQLQYWDRSGFISPSLRTRGNYRRYTFGDVVLLELAHTLREHQLSVQKLRDLMGRIRRLLPGPFHEESGLTLFIEGDRIMVFTGTTVFNPSGKRPMIRFDVADVREKVNRLFPEAAKAPSRRTATHRALVG